jgi:hypothetical protein
VQALTLTEPWATLVAVGAKQIETRHWRTPYRGLLAIHAAKGFPDWAQQYCLLEPFRSVLTEQTKIRIIWDKARGRAPEDRTDFPLGKVIAICRLRNIIPTEEAAQHISAQELAFGDYSRGRWAWVLSDIQRLIHAVPARGALGLWEWDPGPDWERALGVRFQ